MLVCYLGCRFGGGFVVIGCVGFGLGVWAL